MADAIPAERAARIRIVVVDVDGVLTDGGLYLGEVDGKVVEMKRFHVADGLGIKMLAWAGLRVVLVSGRPSAATEARALELDVECRQVPDGRKVGAVQELLDAEHAEWEDLAVVGDDLADLPLLRRAGVAVAVRDAAPELLDAATWVPERRSGHGAVRELAEALLSARGEWSDLVEAYCRSREEGGTVEEYLEAR